MSSPEAMKPNAFDANDPEGAAGSSQEDAMMVDLSPPANTLADAAEPPNSASASAAAAAASVLLSTPSASESWSHTSRDTTPTPSTYGCVSSLPPRLTNATFRAASPALTNELVELVVCFSLRLLPDKFYLGANPNITHPLNVLSRSAMPTPSKVALMHMPAVTLDTAAECAGDVTQLLNMMLHLASPPYRRPIAYNGNMLLTDAAQRGSLAVLQWWFHLKETVPLVCDAREMVEAALCAGHVHMLDWLVDHGFTLPTADLNRIWSSSNVAVLDWCLEHGLAPEYDEDPIDVACEDGNVDVLAWWQASGLPLKYSHQALTFAIAEQQHDVLDWWAASGLKMYGDELELTRLAVHLGDMFTLRWLEQNNLLLVHSTLLGDVFEADDINVIQWCMDRFKMLPSSLALKMDVWVAASKQESTLALDLAETLGFEVPSDGDVGPCLEMAAGLALLPILEWWLWKIPTLSARHFEAALTVATSRGRVATLDWIKQHGYFVQSQGPNVPALTKAAQAGHVDVIDWFAKHPKCGCGSRAHHEFPSTVFLAAVECCQASVVDWWRKNTLTVPTIVPPTPAGRQTTVLPSTPGRQAFVAAAKCGRGDVLKTWVDAKLSHSQEPLDLPVSLVKDVLFALVQNRSTPIARVKWWATLAGCRSHMWCTELVTLASSNNNVDLLDWMYESQMFDAEYAYTGVQVASQRGNVKALDWWAAHADDIKMSFSPAACFGTNQTHVKYACHWWAHNSAAPSLSLDACELPRKLVGVPFTVTLIDRMLRLGLFTLPTSYSVYDEASSTGRVDVLMWWYATELVGKKAKRFSKDGLMEASIRSHINVLEWWRIMTVDGPCTSVGGKLRLKLPFRSLDDMIGRGDIGPSAVEWWIESGLLPETVPESDQGDGDGEEDDNEEDDEDDEDDEDGDGDDDLDDDQDDDEAEPMAVDDAQIGIGL